MQIDLKERLIGAAVLVILAAIIIPWALKGGSPPSATVTQSLALPQATTTPEAQTTYHMALNGPTDTAISSTTAVPPAAATASSHVTAPVAQPSAASNQSTRAVAPVPTERASTGGKWVVQAGSYGSERNALAVEHKLVKRGYHAYMSRYHKSGRTYYRVRVGPYSNRSAAERIVKEVARAYGGHAAVVPDT